MTADDDLRQNRLDALLTAVLGQVKGDDPRINELVSALIRHLHAFVRETRPPTRNGWPASTSWSVPGTPARPSVTSSSCCRTCSA